ncbi:MAG: FAD-dependent oxidoreductase [Tenacibaculum sp.]
MNKQESIIIIGAGLCGSLLALRLAQRGYKVRLYESRSDLRKVDISSGRSINLALSARGFKALQLARIKEKVIKICVPMYGRMVHDVQGSSFASNYSGREGEYINSVSRGKLNEVLLNEVEKHKNVSIYFNAECISVDIEKGIVYLKDNKNYREFSASADVIFGADGAGSVLRKSYFLSKKFLFNLNQAYLTHGYKELEIPSDTEGKYKISKNYLHIWPQDNYMLIALPNLNGSFTVTLFLGLKTGKYSFKNLISQKKISYFFKTQFNSVFGLISDIASQFVNNPTGVLGTVKCSPWHYKGKTLLIGDAAHAVVPFYGQGMNASFEDITVLDKVLDKWQGNWEKVFKAYQQARKQDTDAIADLAIENYREMRNHVSKPLFKQKRKIEMNLEKTFPTQYFSKYSMVSFNENTGYHQAMIKGRAQDKALLSIISSNTFSATDKFTKKQLISLLEKVQNKTNQILEKTKTADTHYI